MFHGHRTRISVKDIVFVRGNHEDSNWIEFVAAWPHGRRPLHALYASAYTVGPLVMVGFPCFNRLEGNALNTIAAILELANPEPPTDTTKPN
jgi:hypothetical protein